jgi:hypothetical protein
LERRLDHASSGQEACAPILNAPATHAHAHAERGEHAHAHAHAGRGHAPATGKELKVDSKVERVQRVEKIEKVACLKEARARAAGDAEEQAMRWAAANAAADAAHPPNRAAQAARRREAQAVERQRKIGGHAGKPLALGPGVAGVSIGTNACKEHTHACKETC